MVNNYARIFCIGSDSPLAIIYPLHQFTILIFVELQLLEYVSLELYLLHLKEHYSVFSTWSIVHFAWLFLPLKFPVLLSEPPDSLYKLIISFNLIPWSKSSYSLSLLSLSIWIYILSLSLFTFSSSCQSFNYSPIDPPIFSPGKPIDILRSSDWCSKSKHLLPSSSNTFLFYCLPTLGVWKTATSWAESSSSFVIFSYI